MHLYFRLVTIQSIHITTNTKEMGFAHQCHLYQSTLVIIYNIFKSGGPPDFFFYIRGEVENRQVEPGGVGGEEEEDLPLFEAGGRHFSDWSLFLVGCIHPVW